MKCPFFKHGITLLIGATFIILSGCATIVSKSVYPISITSNPPGAKITVMDRNGINIYTATTPATLKLNAGAGYFVKASYTVTFEMPGYQSVTVPVYFSVDGWFYGNIALGIIFGGIIIDPLTGAMWKLDTKTIDETLAKSSASLDTPTLKIMSYNDIPDKWKAKLIRIN